MLAEYESNIKALTRSVQEDLERVEKFYSGSNNGDLDSGSGAAGGLDVDVDVDTTLEKLKADLMYARAELTKFKSYKAGLGRADKEVADLRYDSLNKLVATQRRQLNALQHKINTGALGSGAGGGGKDDGKGGNGPNSRQHRLHMAEQAKMIARSKSRLQAARASLAESHDHAGTTMAELERNNETIRAARAKINDTFDETKVGLFFCWILDIGVLSFVFRFCLCGRFP